MGVRCGCGRLVRTKGVEVEVSTRLRTHPPSAWCSPCGSAAGSCTCPGRGGRSPCAEGRCPSSCCRRGPGTARS